MRWTEGWLPWGKAAAWAPQSEGFLFSSNYPVRDTYPDRSAVLDVSLIRIDQCRDIVYRG